MSAEPEPDAAPPIITVAVVQPVNVSAHATSCAGITALTDGLGSTWGIKEGGRIGKFFTITLFIVFHPFFYHNFLI